MCVGILGIGLVFFVAFKFSIVSPNFFFKSLGFRGCKCDVLDEVGMGRVEEEDL